MKKLAYTGLLLLVSAQGWASTPSRVLMDAQAKENSLENVVYLDRLPSLGHGASSTLGFRAGKVTFSNLEFRNDYSVFSYPGGEAPSFGLGFEAYPLQYLGNWGGYLNVDYAYYRGSVSSRDAKNSGRSYVSLLPISIGGVYAAEFHPVMRWFSPTVSVGASYNAFFQGGELDHFQARGGSWTLKRSLGVRHSLSWAGLKNSQLVGDVVIHAPFSSSSNDTERFESRTFSLGLISTL